MLCSELKRPSGICFKIKRGRRIFVFFRKFAIPATGFE
jgi:hypothetical protein